MVPDYDTFVFNGMDDEEFIETAPSVQTTLPISASVGKSKTARKTAPSVGKVKTAPRVGKVKTAPRVGKVKTALPFDDVLRNLINEAQGIEWNIEGTGFYIHDRDKLTDFLTYTRKTLFSSLQKQLNSYMFQNRKAGDSLFYYNPDFNRSKNASAPLRKRRLPY